MYMCIYIYVFSLTHMVYCYVMTNIIMNTHNNKNTIYNINIEVIA